jgi:hypothetical protein
MIGTHSKPQGADPHGPFALGHSADPSASGRHFAKVFAKRYRVFPNTTEGRPYCILDSWGNGHRGELEKSVRSQADRGVINAIREAWPGRTR